MLMASIICNGILVNKSLQILLSDILYFKTVRLSFKSLVHDTSKPQCAWKPLRISTDAALHYKYL